MVGKSFSNYETQVACGQAGFHSCGGLAHEGLRCQLIPMSLWLFHTPISSWKSTYISITLTSLRAMIHVGHSAVQSPASTLFAMLTMITNLNNLMLFNASLCLRVHNASL